MSKRKLNFRFLFVVIWLVILTSIFIHDKINLDKGRLTKTIILPPAVESLEVELELIEE